jgi:glyoxylase-like metal-dependent hydrolase (beta-lactamase superfamily II)
MHLITGAAVLLLGAATTLEGQSSQVANEPQSPHTNVRYVEPSSTRILQPEERISNLFVRNNRDPFVLQRLTERVYFEQHQSYGTTFYVGNQGVLLFDPLAGQGRTILAAIRSVTRLPVTAIVYSHNHADHIGDVDTVIAATVQATGRRPRIVASQATVDKQRYLGSTLPKATQVVTWPRGTFSFEGLTVELHGLTRAAHTDDHGIWLLRSERVAHFPDLVNPDQPPFWRFAGSETYAYYVANLKTLQSLDWVYLNGGHGNVGYKSDVAFYLTFLADLEAAVAKAMGETQFGSGVANAASLNAHTAFLPAWYGQIAARATEALRPKYGRLYGFDYATPPNAEMVAAYLMSYR